MNYRERENATLDFRPVDTGSVQETFYPWTLTKNRYATEGVPEELCKNAGDTGTDFARDPSDYNNRFFPTHWGEGVMAYEQYLGFDPVRRIHFVLPFRRFEGKVIEKTEDYVITQDTCGRWNIKKKGSTLELPYKEIITCPEDWEKMKEESDRILESVYTEEAIEKAYSYLREGHERGDYSIRLNLEGFFWTPRELLGIEPHLLAFYDEPELLHDMCEYICRIYETKLIKVIEILQPDVIYFMEDLSGKNGAMISGAFFDEFVGEYYKRLIPKFKAAGAGSIFVDTDGEFKSLIPHFMEAGIEGFLPMDVNAGMDIVEVRRLFPTLKFIGGYNKLMIEKGEAAIDAEFARILPVVKQGGYIVGADHQVPPSAPLSLYQYYIKRLKEVMSYACTAPNAVKGGK